MNRLRYFFPFLVLLLTIDSAAHPDESLPDTSGADRDLIRIEGFFRNVENISCTIDRKEGPLGGLLTTYTGWCKVQKNQYNITTVTFDTSRYEIQNTVFSAYINKLDSTIIVRKPGHVYAAFMKIDLLDHLIRRAYIQRMYVLDSASFRVLQVEFKPEAPYTKYRMVYSLHQPLPSSILMVRKIAKSNGEIGFWQVEIKYNSLSLAPFPDSVFSTDPWFFKRNGKFELVPPYQQYQLLDHTWLP